MASRLWRFLNTDIRELFSAETIAEGTEAAGAVLELADTLQEEGANIQQLAPLVGKISTLLDVLNSPLVQIVGAGLPFVSMAAKLLAFYLEKSKNPPTLEQCVALVSQAAYLESLQGFFKDDELLSRIGETPVSAPVQRQIKQLSELELNEDDARKAVVCFHDCKLAAAFGQVLLARLQDAGLDEEEAQILTARVAWNTYRYMISAWAESGEAVQHLAQPSFSEWRQELTKYQSIDDYLTEQIAKKPLENVFGEGFTFRDIYVPLKAKSLDKNGNEVENGEALNLESWAKNVLQDPQKQDLVMFVQGGPGRGKSVFSRMFADWVREQLYPIWIPVLIRLRDIPKLQESFTNTLRDAVSAKFAGDDWLKDRNSKYLFLLDGFDELLLEGRTSGGLEQFLRQVSQFQRDSQQGQDMGHRVLITGRTLALQGIERQMPDNLERVRIEVMDSQLQQQWLDKWERIFDRATRAAFEAFLQDRRCPDRVKELAREPLLLYLLAAMHRDRELQVDDFEGGASSTVAKIKIYEQFLNWVLTKQRPEWLTRQLTEQEIDDLRRILSEAGLCVVQSGGEFASVKAIEFRLKQDEGAKALLEEAQKRIGDDPLRNALAAFYLQKGSQTGSVEFAHKSFGEFLCADRLKESILEWTERSPRRKRFNIQEEQLHWEIYDLLGYGALTPEIVEYLMGLLTASEEFRPVELFERLKDFYFRWGDGEFIDAPPENMPQKKMRQLREQGIQLGQRQIDVYAGLNVMILLLELHRYGQERDDLKDKIVFYPCGEPNSQGELDDRMGLLCIIGYSRCIGAVGFRDTVGAFLSSTNLSEVDLSGAYLGYTNLNGADLSRAKFRSIDLRSSDLISSDFTGTDLRSANLRDANLKGANLLEADLRGADFSGADLSSADLRGADFSGADLSDAYLSGAYLSGGYFSGADLSRTDLRNAVLIGTDLSGADLSGANLSGANLSGANLSGANLSGANLSDANLNRTNFIGADLSGADLSRADLSRADLSRADLSNGIFGDVRWDENTKWENVSGLETAVNLPEALRQQLGL